MSDQPLRDGRQPFTRPTDPGSPPGGPASGDLAATYPGPSVVAVHSGATQLTIGTILDGQTVVRAGSALVGAWLIGNWASSLVAHIIVDNDAGNDANSGIILAAAGTDLSASAPAVAVKTLERAHALIPAIGHDLAVEMICKRKASGGQYLQADNVTVSDLPLAPIGFSRIIVRGTDTNASAGSTAWKCDAADQNFAGGQSAAGFNAAGYSISAFDDHNGVTVTPGTPISVNDPGHGFATGDVIYMFRTGGFNPEAQGFFQITRTDANNYTLNNTSTSNGNGGTARVRRWKITLFGGGAPGFTFDLNSQALLYKRIRFDAATTTVGLRNFITGVQANGPDTIVPFDDITTAVPGDKFYVEEPGFAVNNVALTGGIPGAQLFTNIDTKIELVGVRGASVVVEGPHSARLCFVQSSTAINVTSVRRAALHHQWTNHAGTIRTTGPCRAATTASLLDIDALTCSRVGFMGPVALRRIRESGNNTAFDSCYFHAAVNVGDCNAFSGGNSQAGLLIGVAFPNQASQKFVRVRGTGGVRAITLNMAGAALFNVQMADCLDGLAFTGENSHAHVFGLVGCVGITQWGVSFGGGNWSIGASLLFRFINDFSWVSGTKGDVSMGTNKDPLTSRGKIVFSDLFSGFTQGVIDGCGNRVLQESSNGLAFPGARLRTTDYPNGTGAQINRYNLCRVDNAGNLQLARANSAANAKCVVGPVAGDVDAAGVGSRGQVCEPGQDAWIEVDTSGGHAAPVFGDTLYVGVDTAGKAQTDIPGGGNPIVILGQVTAVIGTRACVQPFKIQQ